MPSGVAFTTKAWSARTATLASHSAMRSPGRSLASASARARVRLAAGHRRARIEQRRGDRARRAAGTEQQHWSCRGLHPMRVQIGHEAIAVGVAAGDLAVPKHQCVDRPSALSGLVDRVADLEGGDLVGNRNVGAGEPSRQQSAHRRRKLTRPNGQRDVGTINSVALQPEPVQARRAGIRDGPAGNTGDSGVTGQRIDMQVPFPRCSAKINAGFIQTPRSRSPLPLCRAAG